MAARSLLLRRRRRGEECGRGVCVVQHGLQDRCGSRQKPRPGGEGVDTSTTQRSRKTHHRVAIANRAQVQALSGEKFKVQDLTKENHSIYDSRFTIYESKITNHQLRTTNCFFAVN